MVMLWSSLATKDARLAVQSLRRLRPIPAETSWATYVRCHDDIGWAVGDVDARAVGYDPFAHRDFLNAFYSGRFPLSFARGELFGENPRSGDARISGSAAALCGISEARERGDAVALDAGIRRLVLLHAVTLGWGGVPLLYMGDELAQGNDASYRADPALAEDNRWMHRPYFDDAAAARRHEPGTVEGRVFGWFRALVRTRAGLSALHAAGESAVLPDRLAARAGLASTASAQRPLRRVGQLLGPAHHRRRPRARRARQARHGAGLGRAAATGERAAPAGRAVVRLARRGLVDSSPRFELPNSDAYRAHPPSRVGESDMAESAAPPQEARPRRPKKRLYTQLWVWVLVGIVAGILVGLLAPGFAKSLKILADLFIQLIKVVIGPVIFCTVIVGIASLGNLARAGGLALRALGYFFVATVIALFIGLLAGNLVQPGAGFQGQPSAAAIEQANKSVATGESEPGPRRVPAERAASRRASCSRSWTTRCCRCSCWRSSPPARSASCRRGCASGRWRRSTASPR